MQYSLLLTSFFSARELLEFHTLACIFSVVIYHLIVIAVYDLQRLMFANDLGEAMCHIRYLSENQNRSNQIFGLLKSN
jgi:hypothetical protein